jgi:hypothetical protein
VKVEAHGAGRGRLIVRTRSGYYPKSAGPTTPSQPAGQ